MKKISILGSTGSIGTQTLEVVRENKDIEVLGLAAGNNIALLEKQIREFMPKVVAVWKEEKAAELRENIKDLNVKVVSGMDGLIEISVLEDEIEELEASIVESEKQLVEAQEKYEHQRELLITRIVARYEAGETTFLDVLLSSKDISFSLIMPTLTVGCSLRAFFTIPNASLLI